MNETKDIFARKHNITWTLTLHVETKVLFLTVFMFQEKPIQIYVHSHWISFYFCIQSQRISWYFWNKHPLNNFPDKIFNIFSSNKTQNFAMIITKGRYIIVKKQITFTDTSCDLVTHLMWSFKYHIHCKKRFQDNVCVPCINAIIMNKYSCI